MAGRPIRCHTGAVFRVIGTARVGTGTAAVLLSALLAGALGQAAEIYTRETLDRDFKVGWSKAGRNRAAGLFAVFAAIAVLYQGANAIDLRCHP